MRQTSWENQRKRRLLLNKFKKEFENSRMKQLIQKLPKNSQAIIQKEQKK